MARHGGDFAGEKAMQVGEEERGDSVRRSAGVAFQSGSGVQAGFSEPR